MKTFQNFIKTIGCFILCTLIISCSEKDSVIDSNPNPNPEPDPTPIEEEYDLADNVIEMKDDLLDHIFSLKGDTLVYKSNTPDNTLPKVGDILMVTQPTEVFPYGFLGKVTKISKNDQINIITEDVALDEAFDYLDVEGTYVLNSDDVQNNTRLNSTLTLEYPFTVLDCIEGKLKNELNIVVNLKLTIDKRNGKNIRSGFIEFDLTNHANIEAGIINEFEKGGGKMIEKLGNPLQVGRIMAGPIIIVPAIQAYVTSKIEGSFGFSCNFDTWKEQKIIMNFNGTEWSMSTLKDENNWNFQFDPELKIEGSAYLGGGLALDFKFYNNDHIKVAVTGELGMEASGEVNFNYNNLNGSLYSDLKDSGVALDLKGGVGLEATAKIFFLDAKWEHPLYEKIFLEKENYIFPSFSNNNLSYLNGEMLASTTLERNVLWKQEVGLSLYNGDKLIQMSDPVEYKNEKDFIHNNPLEEVFYDIPENKLSDYSVWTHVKWGDIYVKCEQLTPVIPAKKIKSLEFWESENEEMIYKYSFSYENNVIKEIEYENIYQGTTNYVFNYLADGTINVIGINSDEKDTFTLILNKDGYIESCHHIYEGPEDSDSEDFEFEYNENGQLTTMIRSEEDETWNIVYNALNAVDISCNERKLNDITYGNEISPENMIMFEWMYGLDVDDMSIFGFIGMLGKSSNNLPIVNKEYVEGFTMNYDWSLDISGYPNKVIIDEDGFENEVIFTWE